MILRYALQVHLVTAIEELIFIALLYINWCHFNISLLSGKFRLVTVGALFCELLIENGTEYYHYQRNTFNGLVIVDFVVTISYAQQKDWIKTEEKVINPMRKTTKEVNNDSDINRISMVTISNVSPQMMRSNNENVLRTDDFDRMSMVTSLTDAIVSKRTE